MRRPLASSHDAKGPSSPQETGASANSYFSVVAALSLRPWTGEVSPEIHVIYTASSPTSTEFQASPHVIFDILQFLALGIAVFTILPPLFSSDVYRMKTWFCLIISCIFYCISFVILVGQQDGPQPSFALCTFQAGLIYAAPPM